jgi:hypothetical protein
LLDLHIHGHDGDALLDDARRLGWCLSFRLVLLGGDGHALSHQGEHDDERPVLLAHERWPPCALKSGTRLPLE